MRHDVATLVKIADLGISSFLVAQKGRIEPRKRECACSLDVHCPSKAERPAGLGVEIVIRNGKHSIGIFRFVSVHFGKNARLITRAILIAFPAFYAHIFLFIQNVNFLFIQKVEVLQKLLAILFAIIAFSALNFLFIQKVKVLYDI